MRIVVLSVSALLVACSSWQLTEPRTPPIEPFATPPTDLAQICVLRPHSFNATLLTFPVRDNGRVVGATRGASYFCYFAKPGRHRITSEADDISEANTVALPGARYYLHQTVKNTLGYVTTPLEWVPETEARTMVSKCDYRVLTGTPDDVERPPVNPVAAAEP